MDHAHPTGGALELARSAAPAPARRRTALAAVARPAGEVAGLLLVEVLCSPRARAPSLDLARSLAGWLAGRRPPASARAEVTTRRVPVVKDAGTSVLVHRVETALVVLTPEPERMRPLAQSQPGQGRVGAEIPAGPDQPGHVRGSRDLHDATRLLDPADQSHWGRAGRRE